MLIIHKPYLGSRYVPHKIWAQSFQPFWRLWDTNGQTPRQAKCIFRLTTFCPPEFYFLLSWFNSFGLLALKPSVPRLLIVTPTVYPHLVDFTRKLNFQNKSRLNQLKNLKTKLSKYISMAQLSSQSKFDANRSRDYWVMIGQTNKKQ